MTEAMGGGNGDGSVMERIVPIFFRSIFYWIYSEEVFVMPLVVFSGLPASGKTTRALQLQKALEDKCAASSRKFKIHLINDDTLGINREVYRGIPRS